MLGLTRPIVDWTRHPIRCEGMVDNRGWGVQWCVGSTFEPETPILLGIQPRVTCKVTPVNLHVVVSP